MQNDKVKLKKNLTNVHAIEIATPCARDDICASAVRRANLEDCY